MSMTQKVLLRKADLPTNQQIQDFICSFGYRFSIPDNLGNKIDNEGLPCVINGHETYLEIFLDDANEEENLEEWIRTDVTNQDTVISFMWGADTAAGACISLVSLALIDLANALVYYVDDEMRYSREMLVDDISLFLAELN